MRKTYLNLFLNILIALVWFVNGLICKILNVVPRHEMIVSELLGNEHSRILTILIGISELIMVGWILSRYRSKWNAISQIVVVMTMNIIEFTIVPELLLWGRWNIVFALIFSGLVYYNEFILNKFENELTR
ncbi:hypothetical protein BST97_03305 [Nonlabens spongiae]|uniref:DoxX family protein n=1 Tax=Nonlabens spongiae TaxID=331648 RepID=A0A1W6MHN1_9FLAO|nr:DoxX-like family protein [Nonlabens spongiae]ARN77101.1 hypothetical protein BST97_03305 [Nonlabens spongiae]